VRRPTDFTVRDGATASIQDAVEGKFSLAVDKQKGVDFKFTSSDLTLRIDKLSERIIKPAMVQLANQIDRDLTALYKNVWNWVGTPGQTVDSFADFAKAPERLDLAAVPQDERLLGPRHSVLRRHERRQQLAPRRALRRQDCRRPSRHAPVGPVTDAA
jgi:hypothetical protein